MRLTLVFGLNPRLETDSVTVIMIFCLSLIFTYIGRSELVAPVVLCVGLLVLKTELHPPLVLTTSLAESVNKN